MTAHTYRCDNCDSARPPGAGRTYGRSRFTGVQLRPKLSVMMRRCDNCDQPCPIGYGVNYRRDANKHDSTAHAPIKGVYEGRVCAVCSRKLQVLPEDELCVRAVLAKLK